ncbi:helix-turn-helix domain-containing protein [Actinobacillus suis]|uniref:Helix-turn-helix transcriptional regulator n=1 Tax=Actinobacillus suis TaxID=716 RepID=A0ABT1WS93_ACTSU|nr:DNA-binding protein [Actinobacillus suis]MCQ9629272.1 helix-turn-helix transcriptional regulator [Actinobacillus suis]MCQ9632322.1 helix-turn-helix transcriptional regulator [Actinobacillus suis]
MRNFKEWFSANELTEFEGLPNSPQGINKKARTQQWKKRNKDGVQGGAVEYHYSSLPESVQGELRKRGIIPQALPLTSDYTMPSSTVKNSKEWLSVSELLAINSNNLPNTDKGISKKADREQWEKRQRAGVKGKTFEYHYSSLPESVQLALGFEPSMNSLKQSKPMPALAAAQSADSLERVPFYNITASAGFTAISEGTYAPDDYIGLSKRWLNLRGFYLNQLAFITASGDSMYPTISDGDMLLVNLGAKQPKDGKIYVLRSGEQIWVKRVQGIINGIRLISDNKEIYDPVDVIFNDSLDFEVIGQVVYIGHDLI